MGRTPKTLTESQLAEVETLAALLTSDQIADVFGMGRRTFYELMARDEEIAARYKRGKARAVGSVAQSLVSKAKAGNVTAMIFYLKTQGGWRETQEIAHTGIEPITQITRIIIEPAVESDADAFTARMAKLQAQQASETVADQLAGTEARDMPSLGLSLGSAPQDLLMSRTDADGMAG